PLRAHRRHVHRPGREHLPERDRGHAARDRGVRRRVPRRRLAPRDDGRVCDPRRVRPEPCRPRAPGEAPRHDDRAAPGPARRPPRRRARGRGRAPAHRVQGAAGRRRPRPLPSLPPRGQAVTDDVDALARQVVEGSPRATARALTWVESGGPRAEALAARLYRHTGRAHVVGITGAPGSGKSTLARALARVARGALGGLCRAAADAIDVLDAAGRSLILVETVGVGQDEVDVMRVAHTVVVVSVPGLGDDVQALKAGILEIADLHVVNKADREGADRTLAELRSMLTLMPAAEEAWMPPVLGASAAREEGVEAIADALEAHMASM